VGKEVGRRSCRSLVEDPAREWYLVVNLAGSIDSRRQFPLSSFSASSSVKENIDEDVLSVSEDDL
jgi:hypothetical protein